MGMDSRGLPSVRVSDEHARRTTIPLRPSLAVDMASEGRAGEAAGCFRGANSRAS